LAVRLLIATVAGPAKAQTQSIAQGERLAERNCSVCHAIGLQGASPNASAPPFRDIHKRFSLDDLEVGMLSDLLSGHPAMPQFRLHPDEVRDLLMYIKSLGNERRADIAPRSAPKGEAWLPVSACAPRVLFPPRGVRARRL
jgi:mono/diheme cytochrome c family protein